MKRGKKYVEAAKKIDRAAQYEVADAVKLIKETAVAKFDETVEAHIRLGVDGRHADQQIRGAVVLPHGTGKTVRVLVFAKGDKVDEALAAGADYAGGVPDAGRHHRFLSLMARCSGSDRICPVATKLDLKRDFQRRTGGVQQ